MSSPYADYPEIDVTDPSTVDHYGSDTLSEWFKIVNGKIIGNRRPHIKSPWLWQSPLTLEAQLTPPAPDTGNYALATGQVNIYPNPSTGRLVVQKSNGQVVELENIISVLQDLSNVQITSVADNDNLKYNALLGKWTNQPAGTGTGEANTASNVGTAGIGLYKQKTGVNLEFKKLFPASTKIAVTDDTANSRITLDVLESALTIANLSGNLTVPRGGTGATTLTGILKGNGTSAVTAAAQLAVADGGTGASTITGIVRGNGTGAFTGIGLGNSGDVLTNVGGTPQFQTPVGGGGVSVLKKFGAWYGTGAVTGSGLLNGIMLAGLGTYTQGVDSTNGNFLTATTGTSSGNPASVRTSYLFTAMGLNPIMTIRVREANITSNRLWVGLVSDVSSDPVNSTYLNSKSGFMLALDQNGTTWKVGRNDGTSTAPALIDTGVSAVNNTVVKIILKFVTATPKLQYSINDAAFVDVTGNIPATSTALGINAGVSTTTSASRSFDGFYMDITQDN